MAINFPNSPTNGQTFVAGSATYSWNSSASTWDLVTAVAIGPTGPAGTAGAPYGNLDGGSATSNYSGLTAISGGNASGN
jgi:hypothetical protein